MNESNIPLDPGDAEPASPGAPPHSTQRAARRRWPRPRSGRRGLRPAVDGVRASLTDLTSVREWLRGSSTGLLCLALATGVGAGLGAIVFRELILGFTQLFSGHQDYSNADHAANHLVPFLGMWFVLFAPVIAGLLYGPLVDRFAREARGHGVPEVMLAVAERGGHRASGGRGQVAGLRALHRRRRLRGPRGPHRADRLGAWFDHRASGGDCLKRGCVSWWPAAPPAASRLPSTPPSPACSSALELILRDFETESFSLVVLASIAADVIGRAAFGSQAFLSLPPFHVVSFWEYFLYALLGLLAAGVGVAFIRVLYGTEDLCDALWHGPEWLRPAAGGLLLGLLLLVLPEMYGVGYPVLENGIRGQYVFGFLLVLSLGKMVATSLTIGIGGSGGVFAPSLFIGAMLGTAYGDAVHTWLPLAHGTGRRLWAGGHGRGLRRGGARPDHRRDHHVRADRRLHDHPALDVRRSCWPPV